MPEVLQHIVVTLVAVGAAGVIIRRVTGLVLPGGTTAPCANCPSAKPHSGSAPVTSPVKPLTLVRR